jgi:hypothetical protein
MIACGIQSSGEEEEEEEEEDEWATRRTEKYVCVRGESDR